MSADLSARSYAPQVSSGFLDILLSMHGHAANRKANDSSMICVADLHPEVMASINVTLPDKQQCIFQRPGPSRGHRGKNDADAILEDRGVSPNMKVIPAHDAVGV